MAAAGVIGTGTHNTGIKHGILPTQVRCELGECQCMVISILRASGEMSHHPVRVWCAQPWGKDTASRRGPVPPRWSCYRTYLICQLKHKSRSKLRPCALWFYNPMNKLCTKGKAVLLVLEPPNPKSLQDLVYF